MTFGFGLVWYNRPSGCFLSDCGDFCLVGDLVGLGGL